MYKHHNFPKALIMTLFKILKATTAANSVYTTKALLVLLFQNAF